MCDVIIYPCAKNNDGLCNLERMRDTMAVLECALPKYFKGLLYQYDAWRTYRANMEPIWGRQDPGGPHVGPMNLALWAHKG